MYIMCCVTLRCYGVQLARFLLGGGAIFSKPEQLILVGFAPFDWSIHRERFFIFFVSFLCRPVENPYRKGTGGIIFSVEKSLNIIDRILGLWGVEGFLLCQI